MFLPAAILAQETISLSVKNINMQELFSQIEKKSSVKFSYLDQKLDNKKDISLDATNQSIESILNRVLPAKGYAFVRTGNTIAIKTKEKVTGPVKTITGIVVDNKGETVIGANVSVKGTTNGTITDIDGKFTLEASQGETLAVSYIGYTPMDQSVGSESNYKITLNEETHKIDEVVVVGYGTRQRKSITGAVDQVKSDVFENRPVSNATQALQGASANLVIQQKNMNPNDNSMSINIRGVSTMGNNDPLIVIDGLISSAETLNNLNPNDIENVSVLKDAGSAAIYGSRSANGVILVTTKKGSKMSKPVVTFNGMVGFEDPNILYQPVKGWQNAMYRNQANMNVGSAPQFAPSQIRDLAAHQNEESWFYNDIMQKGLQQTYNLGVSGGTENSTYMVSAGYYNQESNFKGGFGTERYNFRTNLSTEYGRFKLTSVLAYTRRNERTVAGGTGNVIINSSRIPSYYYYKFQENGKYLINDVIGDDNALAKLQNGGYENKDEDNVLGSLNLDFKIIDGLKARGIVGLDLTQHHRYRRDLKVPLYASADAETPTTYLNSNTFTEDYNQKRYTLSTQFLLDFNRTFNKVHNVTAMLGTSNESYTRQENRIAWEYTDPDLGLPTSGSSQNKDNKTSNAGTDQTSITSVFGRAGYNYMDKYYGDVSFRWDGSSKFAKDYRWGFFPSFSAAWRASEESFMEKYKENFGDLKVRASYGVLGNQNVDNYSYQTVYKLNNNSYVFNNSPVVGTGFTLGNSILTWERAANFNVGVDATFLRNSLYVSLDYFNRTTDNILLSPEVSNIFGTSAAKQNAGKMQNQGWEATITYKLKSGDFNHSFNFNIADSKNKVVDFGGKERIDKNDELYKIIREGEALGSYFGYKTAGLFQSYEEIANSALPVGATVQPGDVKYVDSHKDGVIDEKDRVILGNAFPRYTFGFTYDVAYKGFDMSVFFQGVGKRDMYVRGELIEPFHSNYSYAIYQHQLDFWTPTNPDAQWPRLVAPGSPSSVNNWGRAGTDIYLLNAAYLRLKNIRVGYTLPKHITQKAGIQKLRISVNAQNPLTFTKNSYIDPESSEFSNNMGGIGGVGANSARNYPTLIYYGIGLDLEF